MAEAAMPHVLMFPFPIQGHMSPMLKLAELLYLAGFRITFVNTEYSHRRFLLHSPILKCLDQQPRFRFRTIPDGLPKDDPRQLHQVLELEESLRTRSREHYGELLVPSSGRDTDGWPPITCVVADAILALAIEVTEEMGIPVLIFRTGGACSFWVFRCVRELVENGEIPLPDSADLDEMIQGVPGTESFLRRRDLPSFCREIKSPNDYRLQMLNTITTNATRGRALIFNTFETLEAPMLSQVQSFCPTVYSVGPLHNLVRTFGTSNNCNVNNDSVNVWEEDRNCLTWLDSQPLKSVVYVSFGSIAVMSREDHIEFWHGLVNSDQRFLWVVRPDSVKEWTGASGMMPAEVEKGTRERGFLVEWAPQEEVLAHPAVGCFLTHSGWNSTVESIAAGVPMICWPFFTDQQINSRFISEVFKIGVDMKDKCGRSIVERMVRDVMEGDKTEELRKSAGEVAETARRSVAEGGSSYLDFQKLVRHIKSLSSEQKCLGNK